jgi:DNA-binding PadR family transcriptional regulator
LDEQEIRAEIKQQFIKRLVTNFFDIIVLASYQNQPFNGSEVIQLIEKKFNVKLSAGAVHSILYSMERKQLLKSVVEGSRRVYTVSKMGKLMLEVVTNEKDTREFMMKMRQ